jgi:hypothetical protein
MEGSRFMQRLAERLGALAGRGARHPFAALALLALLAAGGLHASRGLTLSADLTELLPRSFRSVQDLDVLRERFGGIGYVVVVGRGGEPEALRRFADDFAPKLEGLEGIRFVDYKRETAFFEERGLYYLDLPDLEEIAHRLKERERWERRQKNPMLLKLDDEPAPPLEFGDLEAKYAGSSSRRLAGNGEAYYLDPVEKLVVLLAKPAGLSADLAFTKQMVERVEGFFAKQDLSAYGPGFEVALTGTYKKKMDQQAQISRDLAVASSIAGALMLAYLLLHFRRLAAVVLVLVPVGVGLTWTYGFVALTYGSVNLLTAFLGAILGGLGTEHGIHLLGRYIALREEGWDAERATREVFGHTGVSALVSSLIAALTFLSLAISEFRAFREFGVIAAVGMVLVFAAYLAALPAMFGLLDRIGWRPPRQARIGERSELARWLPRIARPVAWAIGLALVVLVTQVPRTAFNYDFAALEDGSLPSFVLDRKVNRLLGYSQTPTIILTDTAEEERHLVAQIQQNRARLGEKSSVDFAAALGDLVPTQQEEKREVLASMERTLSRVDPANLSPAVARDYDRLLEAVHAQPFGREDVPASVRRQFEGTGENKGGFVLVFPRVSMTNGRAVEAFATELRSLSLPGGGDAHSAGEAMILADIIEMVSRESGPVLVAAVVLVVIALVVALGSLREALICLSPTIVSIVALVGAMALIGLRFNFLNIVAVPVLIGTTVDAGVHLIGRLRDSSDHRFAPVFAETGRAICGGLMTSAVGFAALTMADHPGLWSLGTLTILGFALNLLVMLLGFPSVLLLLQSRRAAPLPTTPGDPA